MDIRPLLIDDTNPLHRELPIYRQGSINRIALKDDTYTTYGSIGIDAHNYAAFFHYHIPEALNDLPFLSESGNGLESWDEAYLHNHSLHGMIRILEQCLPSIRTAAAERIVLGWHERPVPVGYVRDIDPLQFVRFLEALVVFAKESAESGKDLEFIL